MTSAELMHRIDQEIKNAPPGLFLPPQGHWRSVDPDGVLDSIWTAFLNDRFNSLHPLVFADRLDEIRDDTGDLAKFAKLIRLDSGPLAPCQSQDKATCDCESCHLRREKSILLDSCSVAKGPLVRPYVSLFVMYPSLRFGFPIEMHLNPGRPVKNIISHMFATLPLQRYRSVWLSRQTRRGLPTRQMSGFVVNLERDQAGLKVSCTVAIMANDHIDDRKVSQTIVYPTGGFEPPPVPQLVYGLTEIMADQMTSLELMQL